MKRLIAIGVMALGSLIPTTLISGETWQSQAALDAPGNSVMEALLLPGLHSPGGSGLDLRVMGPDGKPRAFELYWREEKGDVSMVLSPESTRLLAKTFVWTSRIAVKDRIKAKTLTISILAGDYIGSVDVFGLEAGNWKTLVHGAALYQAQGVVRGEVKLPTAVYEGFRLEFSAYGKKPVPIGGVEVSGERLGKDFAETEITLNVQRSTDPEQAALDTVNFTALLPGSPLYIKEIDCQTSTLFNGDWAVQRNGIVDGKKSFIQVMGGQATGVGKGTTVLRLEVDRVWQGRTINLRLKTAGGYTGSVLSMKAKIRLPRVVFVSDMAGTYLVQTGSGANVPVLDSPTAPRRVNTVSASFGLPKKNPDWKPESLAELFPLSGAPFSPNDYEWLAPVKIMGPGYYRLLLHQKASLEENLSGLRLVRNEQQVPFFMVNGEERGVTLTATEEYDKAKNFTVWHVTLPQASSHWLGLRLKARGLFKRSLAVERDQPGPVGSITLCQLSWTNTTQESSELFVPLAGFPTVENKLRLTMAHGDNQALRIESIIAVYQVPAIYFLAVAGEGYDLFGGNASAGAPSYDLDLIQDRLREQEPRAAELGDPQPLKWESIRSRFTKSFIKTNWGLYLVLGVLAAGLMAIIAFIFPKPKKSR